LRKFKRAAPALRSTLKANTGTQHIARFEQSTEDPDHTTAETNEKKHYYVVIKSFPDFNAADAFKQKLIGDKYNANVFYYDKDKKYHVYVFQSGKPAEAHDEARNLKLYTRLKDARVLTIIVPKE
jgi:cell division septation protein DedD